VRVENQIDGIQNHPNLNLINHQKCGITPASKITGGKEAAIGQYPWIALLQYKSKVGDSEMPFLCGGSLISARYVLTGIVITYIN
jgi:secreted trypsin-like serine protease